MFVSSQLRLNIFSKVRGKKLRSQLAVSGAEDWRCRATGEAEDPPEDGHLRRFVHELVQTVHHPGVKLDQVHHLRQVGVFPQGQRRLVDAGVSLAWTTTNEV